MRPGGLGRGLARPLRAGEPGDGRDDRAREGVRRVAALEADEHRRAELGAELAHRRRHLAVGLGVDRARGERVVAVGVVPGRDDQQPGREARARRGATTCWTRARNSSEPGARRHRHVERVALALADPGELGRAGARDRAATGGCWRRGRSATRRRSPPSRCRGGRPSRGSSTRSAPQAAIACAAATAALLNRQKPIGVSRSAWWPGGRSAQSANGASPASRRSAAGGRAAGSVTGRLERPGAGDGVEIDRAAAGRRDRLDPVDVGLAVDPRDLLAVGGRRLGPLEVRPAGPRQRGLDRDQAPGVLRVRPGVVAVRAGMGEIEAGGDLDH